MIDIILKIIDILKILIIPFLFLFSGDVRSIPGFWRAWREFKKKGALDRTRLETFAALLAEVEHDGCLALV